MSHPLSKVDVMKQYDRIPNETPQEICGWAEAANAAAVAGLRRMVGDGACREQLGRVVESLRCMESQASSLKWDLAGRLGRAGGGAGVGGVLRDQSVAGWQGWCVLPAGFRGLTDGAPDTRGDKCRTLFLRWML